jgi:hypothetical protein
VTTTPVTVLVTGSPLGALVDAVVLGTVALGPGGFTRTWSDGFAE